MGNNINIKNIKKDILEEEINKSINKANTSISFKIKNFINLKFNNSNDISIKLFSKNDNQTNINNKKISCDLNENKSLEAVNKSEINKKRNKTLFYKRKNNIDISLDEKDEISQSYAFQNLINLNGKGNKGINNGNNNKIIEIPKNIKKNKKRLEKSPECIKFFLTESKKYCHDDDKNKNLNLNNNKEYKNKTIDTFIENSINKSKNLNIINYNGKNKNKKELKKIEEENDNNIFHKSTKFNSKVNDINIVEYDGDLETVSLRYKSLSKKKNKNGNKNVDKNNYDNINIVNDNILINEKDKNIQNFKNSEINNIKSINKENIYKENVDIIEAKNIKFSNYNYNTFCCGFFVSGIPMPMKEDSIIEDSINFLSPCGHKLCSLLFSIHPEILCYFKNENLEISDDLLKNISSLAFPLGAKICIECSFDPKKLIQIPQQIFFNIIENKNGEKLYTCTKYYFIMVKNEDFKKNYKFDISSFFSEKIKNYTNNFKNCILTISRLINGNNSFYIPQGITLLSREPFLNPMSNILNGFMVSLAEERANVINHIINEVPFPEEFGTQIQFYIPVYSTPIIINNKMNIYKIMSIFDKEKQKGILDNNFFSKEQLNYKKLFELISIEHIIFIFSMILLEQKIVFVYNNYESLSQLIFIFISLIHPFSWEKNKICPIISIDTINLLTNSNTFIAGIDEYLLSYIYKNNNNIFNDIGSNNNIIIYNIKQKCFIHFRNRKKITRKDLLHEYKLPTMPEKVINFLIKELKNTFNILASIQDIFNQINDNKENENDINTYIKLLKFRENLEMETKLSFIKSLIMLIGDYNNYTFYFDEEKPLFNKEAFIESHKDKDFKNYLIQIINTNLFNNFLTKQKQFFLIDKNITKEKMAKINEKYYDILFFIKLSSQYPELLSNQQTKKYIKKNIINPETYLKIKTICTKLTLINHSNKKDNNSNNDQIKNYQINKKKTNVLFSGKNYLEDELKNNNKKEFSDNNLDEYKSFYSHHMKESKISTESTTLNGYLNLLNKNDIKENNNETQKIIYIDINNKRKLSSHEKNNDKNQIIKKYLLVPYFLNFKGDDEDYVKEEKTLDIILNDMNIYKRKKNIKEKIPPITNLISTISKYIFYNTYNIKKNKIYIIKNNNKIHNKNENEKNKILKDSTYSIKEIKNFKNKYYKEEESEKDLIKINNIYGIDEEFVLINKSFKACLTNNIEINNQYLSLLKKVFLNYESREHFANLIFPYFFHKNHNNIIYHKQLTVNSFNIFSKIIKICFENLNINDINLCLLLTLACFIYYKIEKDKIIYLYSNFIFNKSDKNQQNEQPYKLWNSENFWIEFFNFEFENNNKEQENNEEDYEYIKNEDDIKIKENDIDWDRKMCLIKTVIGVINIMSKLNLEKNFIVNIIEKIILPVFINDFYYINIIMNLALSANNIN